MAEPIITNYIEISGELNLIKELTEEKRERVEILLQERVMEPVGYKRKHA